MSVIDNQRKRHTSAPSSQTARRRRFSEFTNTAAITPGGLGVRLLRYFVTQDGKMVAGPGGLSKLCRFRHVINEIPHLVQLVSAKPSGTPNKWELEFIDVYDPNRVVTIKVDAPAFKIKLPEAQAAYS